MKAIKYIMKNDLQATVPIIDSLENTLATLEEEMKDPSVYEEVEIEDVNQKDYHDTVNHLEKTITELQIAIAELYEVNGDL